MTIASFLNENIIWIVLFIIILISLWRGLKWYLVPSNKAYADNIARAIAQKKNIEPKPQVPSEIQENNNVIDKPNNIEDTAIKETIEEVDAPICANCEQPMLKSQDTVAVGNFRVHKQCARKMRKEAKHGAGI